MSDKSDAPKGKAAPKPPKPPGELVTLSCTRCAVKFGITPEFKGWRVKDGEDFYCPSGHAQHYKDSEDETLVKAVARADRAEAAVRALEAKNASLKAALEAVHAPPKRHHCWLCHLWLGRHQRDEVTPA